MVSLSVNPHCDPPGLSSLRLDTATARALKGQAACGWSLGLLDHDTLARCLKTPEWLFDEPAISWHKQEAGRRVISLPVLTTTGEQDIFCKSVEHQGWLGAIKRGLEWLPLFRAWTTGLLFQSLQIPTPQPLLWLISTESPREYLLTESLPDTQTIADFLQQTWPGLKPVRQHLWRNRMIAHLADRLRRLHTCRFDHRDLKFQNILISIQSENIACWLLDLDAVRRWPIGLPRQRAVQNLSRLNVSASLHQAFRRSDRLRFLQTYLGERFAREWKWWWRQIDRRTRAKINQNYRRQRVLS